MENEVLTIRRRPLAITVGLFCGLYIFIVTLISLYTGYASEFLTSMATMYPGYEISMIGSIIGFVYGFVKGVIGMYILVYIYKIIEHRV